MAKKVYRIEMVGFVEPGAGDLTGNIAELQAMSGPELLSVLKEFGDDIQGSISYWGEVGVTKRGKTKYSDFEIYQMANKASISTVGSVPDITERLIAAGIIEVKAPPKPRKPKK